MKLRPCIDIHGGRVKQIVGGSIGQGHPVTENYVSDRDASWFAGLYREKNLDGGHIILLDSRTSSPEDYEADRRQALGALREWPGGMQIGGGITAENAADWLEAGASHVIVTSYVFRDGMLDEDRLGRLEKSAGRKRLVLDLSCRRRQDGSFVVVTDRWQKFTNRVITPDALAELSRHCGEFLIHAADVEGKRGGIQEELVRILGSFCRETGFPVTYAGGVREETDLDLIAEASGGSLDVTVGSALRIFGGALELDALAGHAAYVNAQYSSPVSPELSQRRTEPASES